jgi:hypothetical protein
LRVNRSGERCATLKGVVFVLSATRGLKPEGFQESYAALKGRSSTVLSGVEDMVRPGVEDMTVLLYELLPVVLLYE